MVFDHNWGGGSQPEPHPYCKTPLFLKHIYIFNYTQFVVVPKKSHIYQFKTFREGLKKIKKLAFDQKGGGGVGTKTNLLILFLIFLQTMNIASRLLDYWRTVKRNHISTIHTIIKGIN